MQAAGGVVWRRAPEALEVAVVHRPRYDDWSLPKGKLDRGEDFLEAAEREVEEEIGATCRVGEELPAVTYTDNKGRSKIVRYWLMEAVGGDGFAPNDEVDELVWARPDEADGMLSYDRDREVLAAAVAALG